MTFLAIICLVSVLINIYFTPEVTRILVIIGKKKLQLLTNNNIQVQARIARNLFFWSIQVFIFFICYYLLVIKLILSTGIPFKIGLMLLGWSILSHFIMKTKEFKKNIKKNRKAILIVSLIIQIPSYIYLIGGLNALYK